MPMEKNSKIRNGNMTTEGRNMEDKKMKMERLRKTKSLDSCCISNITERSAT
jgi:hypothetical protein